MATVKLTKAITEQMFQHALESYPEECCGFLFGIEDIESNRVMSEIMMVENIKDINRKIRFEIDPLDYLKAEKKAEDLDLHILSIYHTHPEHPAKPSEHDRVQAVPYFSYIIMSVTEKAVVDTRSWQLNSNEIFDEEKLETGIQTI